MDVMLAPTDPTASVDDPMPGEMLWTPSHRPTHRPRAMGPAQVPRNLPIGHNPARRYTGDGPIDARKKARGRLAHSSFRLGTTSRSKEDLFPDK